MKQNIKSIPMNTSPSPLKIKKANVKIILEDKQGNKEVIADHNMPTNALSEFFVNCGWLNRDNAPQDSLVQELLGGIMLFDDEIDEDADVTYVPSGLHMVANGAVGTTNSGAPYELGSCSAVATETGWQDDGSYLQTYRWDENHGNGTIASLALTEKHFGLCGVGNPSGDALSVSTFLANQYSGTATTYVFHTLNDDTALMAHVSIMDSEAYKIDLSDIDNGNITIKKYRIPTQKINLKETTTSPVELDSTTITTSDSTFISILRAIANLPGREEGYQYNYYDAYDHFWVWNSATSAVTWGTNYTQYLWDIDVVNATIHTYTIPNTSGDTLYGMFLPIFLGDTVAFINGYFHNYYSRSVDTSKIYQFTITNGTVGAITSISNTYGWQTTTSNLGRVWSVSDNKVITSNQDGRWICYDKAGLIYPTNIYTSSYSYRYMNRTDCPHIGYIAQYTSGSYHSYAAISLYRMVDYIATILNLATPVTKDATKTMTVVYTLTFDEEPTP